MGQRGQDSLINAPVRRPLLETATRTGFLTLADEREREVVIGAVMGRTAEWARPRRSPEQFRRLNAPDVAKVAMNFRIEAAQGGGCRVVTETRVYATTRLSRRIFAAYWRLIYPGSAWIRRMWLRAIRLRAETAVQRIGPALSRRGE